MRGVGDCWAFLCCSCDVTSCDVTGLFFAPWCVLFSLSAKFEQVHWRLVLSKNCEELEAAFEVLAKGDDKWKAAGNYISKCIGDSEESAAPYIRYGAWHFPHIIILGTFGVSL